MQSRHVAVRKRLIMAHPHCELAALDAARLRDSRRERAFEAPIATRQLDHLEENLGALSLSLTPIMCAKSRSATRMSRCTGSG
jgi:hypothetical protein